MSEAQEAPVVCHSEFAEGASDGAQGDGRDAAGFEVETAGVDVHRPGP